MRTCKGDCGRTLVPQRLWATYTAEDRRHRLRNGEARHVTRGLCSACRHRFNPLDFERLTTPAEWVAEEWAMHHDRHRSQAADVRLLAPRLGMTPAALERALLRLKRDGLLAA